MMTSPPEPPMPPTRHYPEFDIRHLGVTMIITTTLINSFNLFTGTCLSGLWACLLLLIWQCSLLGWATPRCDSTLFRFIETPDLTGPELISIVSYMAMFGLCISSIASYRNAQMLACCFTWVAAVHTIFEQIMLEGRNQQEKRRKDLPLWRPGLCDNGSCEECKAWPSTLQSHVESVRDSHGPEYAAKVLANYTTVASDPVEQAAVEQKMASEQRQLPEESQAWLKEMVRMQERLAQLVEHATEAAPRCHVEVPDDELGKGWVDTCEKVESDGA